MNNSAPQHRTIRIRLETYRRLKVIAARMGVSMVALIDGWVGTAEAEYGTRSGSEKGQKEGQTGFSKTKESGDTAL